MKIAVGQFMQESHSFTPTACSWEQFRAGHIYRGDEVITQSLGTKVEVAGALDVAREHRADVVPLLACNAVSSGSIQRDVFESLLSELLDRLQAAMPIDGVFLALHGAMVAEGDDDASGTVLAAVRELVGDDVPIAATLDLHANLTQKMVDMADVLVGYHTSPHVDLYEAGAQCMDLLVATIEGKVKPVMAWRQLPMILPAEKSSTLDGAFRDVVEHAVAYEAQPEVLSASVYYVQPWLDLSNVGCSVLVVTDDNQKLAEELAEELADEFWRRRSELALTLTPLDEAVDRAMHAAKGPVILSDGADAPSGGAPGDSPAILRALLDANVQVTTLINVVDPRAVDDCVRAGVGQNVTVNVGGWASKLWSPVEITGKVRMIADGEFKFVGKGYQGRIFQRGRTVVLQSGSIYLQIMELPVFQGDIALYTSLGLDPHTAQIVVVKTPTAFRAAYEPFAADIILVDVPGVTSSNLASFGWKNLSHAYYPFEPLTDWRL